jgi:hypothetical protein
MIRLTRSSVPLLLRCIKVGLTRLLKIDMDPKSFTLLAVSEGRVLM